MSEPYKLTQEDIESIKQGICPRCQGDIELIDPSFFRCSPCNLNFYFLPEDHGVFSYECLNCEHSGTHAGYRTYEPMVCPQCNSKALVRVVESIDNINFP